jgi:hypothetical protein
MTSTTRTDQRPKVIMICNGCGREDVLADAWASWDAENQRWELEQTFDAGYCNDCQRECTPLAKKI